MEFRTVRLSKEVANKLSIIKYKYGFKDINSVVEKLLSEFESGGHAEGEGKDSLPV